MDIRQLIDKINHFENKQILNEGVVNNMTEGGTFDEQELSDVLKAFDEQVNEIGGNGIPDYDKIISALDNGDIEAAMEEIVSAYSDQDGGEIRSNDYDNYLEDLESEFKFLVYSNPSQRVRPNDESDSDTNIRPGMRVSQGTVVKVDGNTVIVKTSNGDMMTMNIHDVDRAVAEGADYATFEDRKNQTSIYKTLIKEFGYSLDEAEEFQFSPEQEKFLGKANRQDPYILARMPGPKPPFSYFKDPEDQAIAKQMNFGANNLNKIKNLVGAGTQGDASTFAAPAAAAPAKMRGGYPAAAQPAPAGAPELVGTQNQTPNAAAQADRIANRMDQEAGANTMGQTAAPAPTAATAAPVTTPAQRATAAAARARAAAKAGADALDPSTQTKPAAPAKAPPEAAMGAGSGAPRVGSNTTIAPNSDAANAERDGVPTAAVATPVTPQTPNNATALPPLAPAAGAEATKIARFKELLGKAKNSSVTPPAATKESIGYFLNKLRFIESRQLNEALTPEEQKEMDGLYAELGQQGSKNNPELVAAINDYNSLPKSAPAFNPRKDSQQFTDKMKADATALHTKLSKILDDALKGPQDVTAMKPIMDQIKQMQADPNFVTMAPKLQNELNDMVKKAEEVVVAAATAAPATGTKPPAPAPAAAPTAPTAAAAQSANGRPATAADMTNANWSYVEKGSDVSFAIDNGFGYDVAAWKAAGSPGKPAATMNDTANMKQNQGSAKAAPVTPVAADPDAPAVTANPNANPAVTPAKTPYKGNAGAQEIQKLNPAIKDVNKIYPGQKFKMPDGSTYTVKPGDTLDKIAKGAKPAGNRATTAPPTNQQDRFDNVKQFDKAPPAAPAPAAPAPVRKELDINRLKQLSGQPAAANPGKVDLSVMNPEMNPVNNASTARPPAKSGKVDLSVMNPEMNPVNNASKKESVRNQDDAILERIRSALKF